MILICLGGFIWQGCSHFDDLNQNPYGVYDSSPASFIQTITFQTQSKILSTSYSMTSELMQHAMSISTSESAILIYNYDCNASHASTFMSRKRMQRQC